MYIGKTQIVSEANLPKAYAGAAALTFALAIILALGALYVATRAPGSFNPMNASSTFYALSAGAVGSLLVSVACVFRSYLHPSKHSEKEGTKSALNSVTSQDEYQKILEAKRKTLNKIAVKDLLVTLPSNQDQIDKDIERMCFYVGPNWERVGKPTSQMTGIDENVVSKFLHNDGLIGELTVQFSNHLMNSNLGKVPRMATMDYQEKFSTKRDETFLTHFVDQETVAGFAVLLLPKTKNVEGPYIYFLIKVKTNLKTGHAEIVWKGHRDEPISDLAVAAREFDQELGETYLQKSLPKAQTKEVYQNSLKSDQFGGVQKRFIPSCLGTLKKAKDTSENDSVNRKMDFYAADWEKMEEAPQDELLKPFTHANGWQVDVVEACQQHFGNDKLGVVAGEAVQLVHFTSDKLVHGYAQVKIQDQNGKAFYVFVRMEVNLETGNAEIVWKGHQEQPFEDLVQAALKFDVTS